MKSQEITKSQYENKLKELKEQNTDFFGNDKLSTLGSLYNEIYYIITFDSLKERDSFIERWNKPLNL